MLIKIHKVYTMLPLANNTIILIWLAILPAQMQYGYWLPGLLFMLLVFFGSIASRGRRDKILSRDDWLLSLSFFIYSATWIGDIIRSGSDFFEVGFCAPVWPLFGIIFLIYLRKNKFPIAIVKSGVFLACLGIAIIAFSEKFIHIDSMHRVSNGVSPIVFGNLALLYSIFALFVLLSENKKITRGMAAMSFLFILGAAMASLLTGSRGGWICLPVVLFVLIRELNHSGRLSKFKFDARSLAFLTFILAFALFWLDISNAKDRLVMIKSDVVNYYQGDVFTSLGLRFEMWRGAWMTFSQHPWFGVGESQLIPARNQLVESGILSEGVIRQGALVLLHLHSDLFDVAARRGLVGIFSTLVFYFVPFHLFFSKATRSADGELRWLSLGGALIPILYFLFGLSYTMMREPQMLAAYLLLITVVWCSVRQIEDRDRGLMH